MHSASSTAHDFQCTPWSFPRSSPRSWLTVHFPLQSSSPCILATEFETRVASTRDSCSNSLTLSRSCFRSCFPFLFGAETSRDAVSLIFPKFSSALLTALSVPNCPVSRGVTWGNSHFLWKPFSIFQRGPHWPSFCTPSILCCVVVGRSSDYWDASCSFTRVSINDSSLYFF